MDHLLSSKLQRAGKPARPSWALFAALGPALLLGCSANGGEPLGSREQSIAGGSLDVRHQSVFLLARHADNTEALCTATLIAPNLLLTARHCVSPGNGEDQVLCGDSVLGDPYPASAFIATNDPEPTDNSPIFKAADVRVPGLGEDTCGYDIALITLTTQVPPSVSVPAVPRIDREVQPGEVYTAVGYGMNDLGGRGAIRVERGGLTIECQPGSCGEGVESTEFRGETGICSGDSGGPALDTDGKVVGVVSRGGPDCGTPVYGTVTAWQDFLIETAAAAAVYGNYTPPFWVTTRSSDPPLVVGAAGASGADSGAALGQACSATSACESGLVCYATNGQSSGICSATCSTTSECSSGLVCQATGSGSVCTRPTHGADDTGGCSLSPAGNAATAPFGSSLMLAGALIAWRRRRRHGR